MTNKHFVVGRGNCDKVDARCKGDDFCFCRADARMRKALGKRFMCGESCVVISCKKWKKENNDGTCHCYVCLKRGSVSQPSQKVDNHQFTFKSH